MARRRLRRRVQPAKPGQQNCSFCNRVVNEEDTKYGETVRAKSFVAHYFCMMFSSGLKQVGDPDEDELRGFLENEVLQEIKRGTRLKCSFCKARGATVGCSRKKCKLGFHLPCGMERECLFQYFDDFGVWCSVHRPRQHIVPAQTPPATCLMCTDHLDPRPSNDVILTPCCRQPFHRGCLERQAATAGCHFFRCCHCKNKKDFQEEMLLCGIYIPDRDAAWEMEPNAFSDLLYEYAQCDAPRCRCPRGKTYSVNNDPRWEVIRCQACGAKGVHVACGNLSRANSGNHEWMCQDCRATLAAKANKRPGDQPPKSQSEKKRITPEGRRITRSQTEQKHGVKRRAVDVESPESFVYNMHQKDSETALSQSAREARGAVPCGQRSTAEGGSSNMRSQVDGVQCTHSLDGPSQSSRHCHLQRSNKPHAVVQPRIVGIVPPASSQQVTEAPSSSPNAELCLSNVSQPHAQDKGRGAVRVNILDSGAQSTTAVQIRKKKRPKIDSKLRQLDRNAFTELCSPKALAMRKVTKNIVKRQVGKSSAWVQLSIVNFVRQLRQTAS
ncbi:PHD finger protein 7-like isoform X1 [Ornithodoros turicata]|uniref:PHD finger protein 7-like isoform X1 n=1 Tax=Ornithodoros turicata TaxID=34597 RepID=UPI0031393758